MKQAFFPLVLLTCAGCNEIKYYTDPDDYRARADSSVWASRNDIKRTAKGCGLPNYEPRPVGDSGTWSFGNGNLKPADYPKFQCLEDRLEAQNLLVTR